MPGVLQPSGLPMQTVMSTKFIAGICVMALLAGSIAFVVTRSFSRDNDRVQQTPSVSNLLKKTPWATPEAIDRVARLEQLSASSSLDAASAGFLLESLTKDLPSVDPSERNIPIAESPQAQRWFLINHEVVAARGVAVRALREDWPMPQQGRDSIESALLSLLDSSDPATRLVGVTLVVNSRMIENPTNRVLIESVRIGDADASVRANADNQLAHYAYIYEGGPRVDRPEGCNTCP